MANSIIKPRVEISIKRKHNRPAKSNGISKRTKKSWTFSFYLVFGLILIAGKRFPQLYNFCLAPLHSLIFILFLVYFLKYWLIGFFYQLSKSFNFPLTVFQKIRDFSSINLLVFFYHFLPGFLMFFTYNYAYHLPTRLLELAT